MGRVASGFANNEVMRSWINQGDYNHILSHDELDVFNYVYGTDLDFTEVGASDPANIVITTYTAGSYKLGHGASVWHAP